MSSVIFKRQDLHALIKHHIALLDRFNIANEAPFALLYFKLNSKKEDEYGTIFQRILRKTDALFQENEHFVVMLPGTDWNGGIDLLSGIQEFLDEDPKDIIVTYPDDGKDEVELTTKLQDLIVEHYGYTLNCLKNS